MTDAEATGVPTITGFTPGVASLGSEVTLSGTNFEPIPTNNKLLFNQTPSGITSATSSTLITRVPAAAGSGRLILETPQGTVTSTEDFYIPPSPYTPENVSSSRGRISFAAGVDAPGRNITIIEPNKVGMFLFDGVAGKRISLQMSETNMPFDIIIYRPDGRELCRYGLRYYGTDVEDGFIDATVLPLTGTYTIVVDPLADSTGSTSLKLFDVPADVTGNISSGQYSYVQITTPGQNGLLNFNAQAGQKVFVLMEEMTIGGGVAGIKTVNNTTVTQQQLSRVPTGGGTIAIYSPVYLEPSNAATIPATGQYTIYVDPEIYKVGITKVSLYLMAPDPTLPISIGGPAVQLSSEAHQATQVGTSGGSGGNTGGVSVPTHSIGRNWWLAFEGTAGQKVSLRMTGITIPSTTYVSMIKPEGTFLVERTSVSPPHGFIDTVVLPATGQYKIFVDPSGTSTGNMAVTLYDASDVTGTITQGGVPLPVGLSVPGQNGVISFSGTTGQRLSLQMSSVSIPGSTTVSVKSPTDANVATTTTNSTGGQINDMTLPANGTYKIVIDPSSVNTGSLTLTLSDAKDVLSTITPGGQPVTLTTTVTGQNAKITFYGTAGQKVSLQLSGSTIPLSYVSINKPDGSVLLPQTSVGTGATFIDTQTLPVAGTYSIIVDPTGSYTGSVTLTLYDAPDVTAIIIPGSTPFNVATTVPGQNARLSFEGTAGSRVSLKVNSHTMGSSSYAFVSILKPNGTSLVAPTAIGPSGGFIDAQTLPSDGVYTLVIDPYSTNTGNMNLTLYGVPPDAGGAIVLDGQGVTVTTTVPGQNGKLTFSGTAGQPVSMKASNEFAFGRTSILKPDGATLQTNASSSGGIVFYDPVTLPVTGTYTILVDPYGTSTGSTTLNLYDTTPFAAVITPGGAAVTATTSKPGQDAKLAFAGAAGQRVSLRLSSGTMMRTMKLSVAKPDGTYLITPRDMSNSGFIDAFALPVAGTYTILIDPIFNDTGSVTVNLYEVVDVMGATTIGAAATNISVTVPGQNARLSFEGSTGQQATVRINGSTVGCVTVTLQRPDGSALTSLFSCNGSFNLTTQTLPLTGTYIINIDPSGTGTGAMDVSVTNP